MKERVTAGFEQNFGPLGDGHVYFAPGRVNLIGEHTDYNGGHVFPCALTIGTYAAVRRRTDRNMRFFSMNFPRNGIYESTLDQLFPSNRFGWTNYPKGVVKVFGDHGFPVETGFDMVIFGNIPNGSGLSSSAALEVVTAVMLCDQYGFDLDMEEIALLCQEAENTYNGMNCGIMDQFTVAMGREDHAIFLDTATLEHEYVPIRLKDASIIIANTNKKHHLKDSAYNDRRRECEQALEDLAKVVRIQSLGELSCEEFEEYKDAIRDPVCRRRAKHAVYENQRTIEAVRLLKKGKLGAFGRLMKEAHLSVSRDFEVTGEELDTLAEAAWRVPGCIGSRMTGGGFGGCTVSIVRNDSIPEFMGRVGRTYRKKIGYQADFYTVKIGGGPQIL
uniref:galactokinase n=1 Tax=Eubacterium cellulosolvens TaxID=29322 RepID=UPI000489870E